MACSYDWVSSLQLANKPRNQGVLCSSDKALFGYYVMNSVLYVCTYSVMNTVQCLRLLTLGVCGGKERV